MNKSQILEMMRDLPEDLDVDHFIYTLWFRRKIERALAEADADEGIPHDDLVRQSNEWRD